MIYLKAVVKILLISIINLVFGVNSLSAQAIKGRIMDAKTKSPLAFVNIRFDETKFGTTTDIDGNFKIENEQNWKILKVSYIGYYDTIIKVNNLNDYLNIYLKEKQIKLTEVEIRPGINPAHRIINAVIENKQYNNPEKLDAFSYESYSKMYFTVDDSKISLIDTTKADSSTLEFLEFIGEQHFVMMENVTERVFKKGKSKEKVLGTKMSGVKNPVFTLLATQFQSFSFYTPFFDILEKHYVNPISKGSLDNYFFQIEDTLYQGNDTVFIVFYRPLKNKKFDGMQGLLYINTNGYAIQNATASPYSDTLGIGIEIQQRYEFVNGQAWFPVELNTNLIFNSLVIEKSNLIAIGKTYLRNIKINPDLSNREFRTAYSYEVAMDAHKKDDSFWNYYRHDTLNAKELKTYSVIDSIGEVHKLDLKMQTLLILATGVIPIWKLGLELDKFYHFNSYEKSSVGLGITTTTKLSKYYKASAFFSYSTSRKTINHGGKISVTPKPNSELEIFAKYKYDFAESGKQNDFKEVTTLMTLNYRDFLVDDMFFENSISAGIKFRALKYFVFIPEIKIESANIDDSRSFLFSRNEDINLYLNDFRFTETSLTFKYLYKEKLFRNVSSHFSLGSKFPEVKLKITKSATILGGQLDYLKFDFHLRKNFVFKYLGKTKLEVRAGLVNAPAPYIKLFNGNGAYKSFYLYGFANFHTMRVNEFLNDRYVSIFVEHNFGKLLNLKNFKPELLIVQNMGWGDFKYKQEHLNLNFSTMQKGYFETGILINKLSTSNISSLGLGLFYRYGPYSFADQKQNLSVVMLSGFTF